MTQCLGCSLTFPCLDLVQCSKCSKKDDASSQIDCDVIEVWFLLLCLDFQLTLMDVRNNLSLQAVVSCTCGFAGCCVVLVKYAWRQVCSNLSVQQEYH